MSLRALGFALVWLGTLALVAVVVVRAAKGVWRFNLDESGEIEAPPAAGLWLKAAVGLSVAVAILGAGLMMTG
jgi:hypothetical protein